MAEAPKAETTPAIRASKGPKPTPDPKVIPGRDPRGMVRVEVNGRVLPYLVPRSWLKKFPSLKAVPSEKGK